MMVVLIGIGKVEGGVPDIDRRTGRTEREVLRLRAQPQDTAGDGDALGRGEAFAVDRHNARTGLGDGRGGDLRAREGIVAVAGEGHAVRRNGIRNVDRADKETLSAIEHGCGVVQEGAPRTGGSAIPDFPRLRGPGVGGVLRPPHDIGREPEGAGGRVDDCVEGVNRPEGGVILRAGGQTGEGRGERGGIGVASDGHRRALHRLGRPPEQGDGDRGHVIANLHERAGDGDGGGVLGRAVERDRGRNDVGGVLDPARDGKRRVHHRVVLGFQPIRSRRAVEDAPLVQLAVGVVAVVRHIPIIAEAPRVAGIGNGGDGVGVVEGAVMVAGAGRVVVDDGDAQPLVGRVTPGQIVVAACVAGKRESGSAFVQDQEAGGIPRQHRTKQDVGLLLHEREPPGDGEDGRVGEFRHRILKVDTAVVVDPLGDIVSTTDPPGVDLVGPGADEHPEPARGVLGATVHHRRVTGPDIGGSVRGRGRGTVVELDLRRVAGEGRDLDPDQRLARWVPGVDLVGDRISGGVGKAEV